MSIDIRIYGVPERQEELRRNQKKLGLGEDCIFLDAEWRGVTWNAKRAWLKPTEATHVLVMEDDVELCEGFLEICERIVNAHPDKVISLFPFQFQRPDNLCCGSPRNLRTPYVEAWPVSGQGIIIPAELVKDCIDSFPPEAEWTDMYIQRWAIKKGISCITSLPAILQHVGDRSVFFGNNSGFRRTAYFDSDPSWANWESREVMQWREVYQEAPLEEIEKNIEVAGDTFKIKLRGVSRMFQKKFRNYFSDKEADQELVIKDEWKPDTFVGEINKNIWGKLIEKGTILINAKAIQISGKGILLFGEDRLSFAFLVKQLLGDNFKTLSGSRTLICTKGDKPRGYSTNGGYIPKWESFDSFDIDELFIISPEAEINQKLSKEETLSLLLKKVIMPEEFPLRLKALQSAGLLAQLPARIAPENFAPEDFAALYGWRENHSNEKKETE